MGPRGSVRRAAVGREPLTHVGRLTIVGLGPAGPELITPQTRAVLDRDVPCWLRTARHPAAIAVAAPSFDGVYESAERFADVYVEICERLVTETDRHGEVVYAVPGSPLVLERTAALLRDDDRVEVELLSAVSFLDLVWARLAVDPVEDGVRLVDGHVFATAAAGQTGPLLVAHTHANHVLSDIKLAFEQPPPGAILLHHLGLPDESIVEVTDWAEIDRTLEADHLTSLLIPEVAEPVAQEFARFDELVRVLRDECPWDRKQTHASLRTHLLEETHEVLEALDARAELSDDDVHPDLDDHLAEELGDLLYQIFFHARLAAERGAFSVSDVAREVHDKLVSRHPHVFGDVDAADADAVESNWEAIKATEKQRQSALDGIPPSLPGLALAAKHQGRAAKAGFDWDGGVEVAFADVEEELAEVRADPSEAEVGDLLFAGVQVARRLGVDPEAAIRGAVHRYAARFRIVEGLAGSTEALAAADETQLGVWWSIAKSRESLAD
ncbi:MAG: nucleoside triphosphate pyrophosphohydrolase [Actinomycetota bacterium]